MLLVESGKGKNLGSIAEYGKKKKRKENSDHFFQQRGEGCLSDIKDKKKSPATVLLR